MALNCCRLAKEKTVYEKEVVTQTAKIDKMAAEGKDEYDIKKQVRLCYDNGWCVISLIL